MDYGQLDSQDYSSLPQIGTVGQDHRIPIKNKKNSSRRGSDMNLTIK